VRHHSGPVAEAVGAHRAPGDLSVRLQRTLQWWSRFLSDPPVRLIPVVPRPRQRVLVYSDAAGDGSMAYVIECGDIRRSRLQIAGTCASVRRVQVLRLYRGTRQPVAVAKMAPYAGVMLTAAHGAARTLRRSPGQITPLELVAARCAIAVALQVVADPEAARGLPASGHQRALRYGRLFPSSITAPPCRCCSAVPHERRARALALSHGPCASLGPDVHDRPI
jgi:hypothetical protein